MCFCRSGRFCSYIDTTYIYEVKRSLRLRSPWSSSLLLHQLQFIHIANFCCDANPHTNFFCDPRPYPISAVVLIIFLCCHILVCYAITCPPTIKSSLSSFVSCYQSYQTTTDYSGNATARAYNVFLSFGRRIYKTISLFSFLWRVVIVIFGGNVKYKDRIPTSIHSLLCDLQRSS